MDLGEALRRAEELLAHARPGDGMDARELEHRRALEREVVRYEASVARRVARWIRNRLPLSV